jgi:glutamyl-tRNA synthetase
MPPLRLALVGALKGPQLFEIMELIGKEETLSRLHYAVSHIESES